MAISIWLFFALLFIFAYVSLFSWGIRPKESGGPFDTMMQIALLLLVLVVPFVPFLGALHGLGIGFFRYANQLFLGLEVNIKNNLALTFAPILWIFMGFKLTKKYRNDENKFLVYFIIFYTPLLALRFFIGLHNRWPEILEYAARVTSFLERASVPVIAFFERYVIFFTSLGAAVGVLAGVATIISIFRKEKSKGQKAEQDEKLEEEATTCP